MAIPRASLGLTWGERYVGWGSYRIEWMSIWISLLFPSRGVILPDKFDHFRFEGTLPTTS